MQWFGKGSNNVEDGRSGSGGKTGLRGRCRYYSRCSRTNFWSKI